MARRLRPAAHRRQRRVAARHPRCDGPTSSDAVKQTRLVGVDDNVRWHVGVMNRRRRCLTTDDRDYAPGSCGSLNSANGGLPLVTGHQIDEYGPCAHIDVPGLLNVARAAVDLLQRAFDLALGCPRGQRQTRQHLLEANPHQILAFLTHRCPTHQSASNLRLARALLARKTPTIADASGEPRESTSI